MKLLILAICLTFYSNLAGQSKKNKSFIKNIDISIGTKVRVTPIYLENLYDYIYFFQINIQEQPDSYLSGFGSFVLTQRFNLNKTVSITFHQSIRRDFLVDHVRFDQNNPLEKQGTEKRFIYDFYAYFQYALPSNKKSKFLLMAGGGFSGFNTGHEVILRKYTTSNNYTEKRFHNNFIYPVVQSGFEWERNKLNVGLIIGYCWENPTFTESSFLLPELSIRYNIFQTKKKE